MQRALEGHRTTETELETALGELQGLHVTAVECMRDAARHLGATQVLEQAVGRAPHVQDHRQAVGLGERELCGVETLLPGPVQAGDEVVEADLAHRHQVRIVTLRL